MESPIYSRLFLSLVIAFFISVLISMLVYFRQHYQGPSPRLFSADLATRLEAISAIGNTGSHGTRYISLLVKFAREGNEAVAKESIIAMGRIDPNDDRCAEVFRELAGQDSPANIRSAALSSIGYRTELTAVDHCLLNAAIQNDQPAYVRLAAVWSLFVQRKLDKLETIRQCQEIAADSASSGEEREMALNMAADLLEFGATLSN